MKCYNGFTTYIVGLSMTWNTYISSERNNIKTYHIG